MKLSPAGEAGKGTAGGAMEETVAADAAILACLERNPEEMRVRLIQFNEWASRTDSDADFR